MSGPYLWNRYSQRLQIECAAWSCSLILHCCLPSNSLHYFFFFRFFFSATILSGVEFFIFGGSLLGRIQGNREPVLFDHRFLDMASFSAPTTTALSAASPMPWILLLLVCSQCHRQLSCLTFDQPSFGLNCRNVLCNWPLVIPSVVIALLPP